MAAAVTGETPGPTAGRPASDLASLLVSEGDPERFVRRALAILAAEFQVLALAALADWESAGVSRPELATAVAPLQRPSWGHWNGLLLAISRARRDALRAASADERPRIEAAVVVARVVEFHGTKLPDDALSALAALCDLVGAETRGRLTWAAAFSWPITLRNRVAHDEPTDPAWWRRAADALRPLVELHASQRPYAVVPADFGPAPWFLVEGAARLAFQGIDPDGAPLYVGPGAGARRVPERAGEILASMQRLLGRTELQAQHFRELLSRLAPEALKGVLLGDYLVGRPVGRGGFATVHLGHQLSTGRRVAVKILHDGLGADARDRFRQEAAFLSRFDHPHVVGVLGFGEAVWSAPREISLDGEPWWPEFKGGATRKSYLVLEWLDGPTLEDVFGDAAARADRRRLVAWFAEGASALSAVHALGLVHRDVKPANLMAGADGLLRLMDFGIARTDDEARTLHTTTGRALGTEPYMSPEQLVARDAEAGVGPRSDVYSLCATFYELFTARRLYEHDKVDATTVATLKRAGEAPARPRTLVKGLPWEIETILLAGLESDPADRYESAAALERDVRHVLADEPIEYERPSLLRRMQLGYRRNRTVTHIVAAFVAAVVAGTALYVRDLDAEQKRTATERDQKEEQRRLAVQATARAEDRLHEMYAERARDLVLTGEPGRALPYLAEVLARTPDDVEARRVASLAYDHVKGLRRELRGHNAAISACVASPDGSRLATGDDDGLVILWSLPSGDFVASAGRWGAIRSLEFTPDGARLLVSRHATRPELLDVPTLRVSAAFTLGDTKGAAMLSPTGRWLAAAQAQRAVGLFDAVSGELVASRADADCDQDFEQVGEMLWLPGDAGVATASGNYSSAGVVRLLGLPGLDVRLERTVGAQGGNQCVIDISRDGAFLAAANQGYLGVWDLRTGDVVHEEENAAATVLLFHPTRLVLAGISGSDLVLFDLASTPPSVMRAVHPGGVTSVDFRERGDAVLTACDDGAARVFSTEDLTPLAVLDLEEGELRTAAFLAGGDVVATAGAQRVVRLWSWKDAAVPRVVTGTDRETGSAFHRPRPTFAAPSGRLIVPTAAGLTSIEAGTGRQLGSFELAGVQSVECSPDGTTLAVWRAVEGESDEIVLLDASTYATKARFAADALLRESRQSGVFLLAPPPRLSWSPDGARLALATHGQLPAVLEVRRKATLVLSDLEDLTPGPVVWDPASRWVYFGTVEGQLVGYAVEDGAKVDLGAPHGSPVTALAVVPTGGSVLVGHEDGRVEERVSGAAQPPRTLRHSGASVRGIAVTHDGSAVVTSLADGTAWVWDRADGRVLHVLRHPVEFETSNLPAIFVDDVKEIREMKSVAVSDDGRLLATVSPRLATVWSLPACRPLLRVPLIEAERAWFVGTRPLLVIDDARPRIVDLGGDPADAATLRTAAHELLGLSLGTDGSVLWSPDRQAQQATPAATVQRSEMVRREPPVDAASPSRVAAAKALASSRWDSALRFAAAGLDAAPEDAALRHIAGAALAALDAQPRVDEGVAVEHAVRVACAPSGAAFAVLLDSGDVRFLGAWGAEPAEWSAAQGEASDGWPSTLSFAPDRPLLVASVHGRPAEVWDVARGERVATIDEATGGDARALADGRVGFTRDDIPKEICVFSLDRGAVVLGMETHGIEIPRHCPVDDLVFADGGVWSLRTHERVVDLEGRFDAAWWLNGSSRVLLSGWDGAVLVDRRSGTAHAVGDRPFTSVAAVGADPLLVALTGSTSELSVIDVDHALVLESPELGDAVEPRDVALGGDGRSAIVLHDSGLLVLSLPRYEGSPSELRRRADSLTRK